MAIRWRRPARYMMGLLMIAVVIYLLGTGEVISTVSSAQPHYLALALSIYPLAIFIYAARWSLVLQSMSSPLPLHMAYQACAGGAFISDITPARAGDLLRPLMLKERIDVNTCLASMIVDHYIDLLAASLLGMAGLLIIILPHSLSLFTVISAGALLSCQIMLLICWLKRGLISGLALRIPSERLSRGILAVHDSISALGRGSDLLAASLLMSIAAWMAYALRLVIIIRALGYEAPVCPPLLLQPLVGLLSSMPLTIGGMGFVEIGTTAVLMASGVPASAGIAAALIDRAFSMTFNGLIGGRYAAKLI